MTEDSAHSVSAVPDSDPADRGAAETASHTAGQPHEGLVEPGGVDTEETR